MPVLRACRACGACVPPRATRGGKEARVCPWGHTGQAVGVVCRQRGHRGNVGACGGLVGACATRAMVARGLVCNGRKKTPRATMARGVV